MSIIYKRGNAEIHANLTPMIDVTFLLIVFFVLVSQIVEVENVPMELPRPEKAATSPMGDEQRAVINLLPAGDGDIVGYRIGTREFPPGDDGIKQLTNRLVELYQANPHLKINLRADRNTHYQLINPVMNAIPIAARAAGHPDAAPRVQLVVIRESKLGE